MSENNRSGLSPTALSTGIGQAMEAASKIVGNTVLQGVDAGANAKTGLAWLDEWIEPFRQQLGGLSFLLPKLLARANPSDEVEHSFKLLFRARDAAVAKESGHGDGPMAAQQRPASEAETDFLAALRVIDAELEQQDPGAETFAYMSDAVREEVGKQVDGSSGLPDFAEARRRTGELHALLKSDGRRRNLPEILDDLKHAVRADKSSGLERVYEELEWVFKSREGGTSRLKVLWEWYDKLTNALGENCLREMLRYDGSMDLWSKKLGTPAAWPLPDALTKTFAQLGFQLSDQLSLFQELLRSKRKRYVLFDHKHDYVFYLWDGAELPEPLKDQHYKYRTFEVEVYGRRLGRTYALGTSVSRILKLPLRVFESRVGMAVWNVGHWAVQDYLDGLQSPSDVNLRAWDIGASQTPVALFVAEYLDSDLGTYYEMGLGCFVYPKKDPAAVGMLVVGEQLAVSTNEAEAAGSIWGYPKELVQEKDWTVRYDDRQTNWKLTPNRAECPEHRIDLTLPRDGNRTSPKVPVLSYTKKFDRWHRSVLMRQGSGESLRLGGNRVQLSVSGFSPAKSYAKDAPLIHFLRYFGLIDEKGNMARKASYSLWTEHMSGELGPPELLRVIAQEDE